MKVRDVFTEVFTGVNIKNNINNNEYTKYKLFQKEAIQYGTILEHKFSEENVYCDINKKYLMQDRDIIISLKKPYKVGTIHQFTTGKNILIQNNFAILRGVNMDLYSYIFVTNYLENIGIDKYLKETGVQNLTLEDIKEIDLPEIPKEKQMLITPLTEKINERRRIFSNILENDQLIIMSALNEVIGDDKK